MKTFLLMVALMFVADSALAQKSARISIDSQGRTVIRYRESGVYRVPQKSVTKVTRYQGFVYSTTHWVGGYVGRWTRNWTEVR